METHQLPKLRFLPPRHAFKVLASHVTGRHRPVGTDADATQIASLKRHYLHASFQKVNVVSYLQSGTLRGRRIVFVHGTPGNAIGWADYLLDVPDNHCHIAIDRPGYGDSNPPKASFSLSDQAKAIFPLLMTIHGKKPIIVGHSSGASVAVQTALDHPHAVGGLLLLAGALDPSLEEANWIQLLVARKSIARLLPRTIDIANRELLGLKRGLLAQAKRLSSISIPISVVHGALDPLVSPANTNYIIRKIKNTRIDHVELKHADHFIPWHSKPVIDRELKRLVERVCKIEQDIRKVMPK